MEVWIGLATVLVGALATGILTYVNVRSRNAADRRLADLVRARDQRLPHYRRLFEVSRVITDVPSPAAASWRTSPSAATASLESWYFEGGAGMFLGDEARQRLFTLLRTLKSAAAPEQSGEPLSDGQARQICLLAEQLREQLTRDMTVAPPQEEPAPADAAPSRA